MIKSFFRKRAGAWKMLFSVLVVLALGGAAYYCYRVTTPFMSSRVRWWTAPPKLLFRIKPHWKAEIAVPCAERHGGIPNTARIDAAMVIPCQVAVPGGIKRVPIWIGIASFDVPKDAEGRDLPRNYYLLAMHEPGKSSTPFSELSLTVKDPPMYFGVSSYSIRAITSRYHDNPLIVLWSEMGYFHGWAREIEVFKVPQTPGPCLKLWGEIAEEGNGGGLAYSKDMRVSFSGIQRGTGNKIFVSMHGSDSSAWDGREITGDRSITYGWDKQSGRYIVRSDKQTGNFIYWE